MTYDPARGSVDGYQLLTVAAAWEQRDGGSVQAPNTGGDADESGADKRGWAGSGGGIGTGADDSGFPWIVVWLAGAVVAAYLVGGRDEEDDSASGTGLALPLVGVGAAGAGLYYLTRREDDMSGPVTGSGSALNGIYKISQEGAHRIYERIWAMVQGQDPYDAASMVGFPSPTWEHMRFFDAWRLAEGGKAAWNAFNTTWRNGSIKAYNKVGVGQYVSSRDGEIANAKTIRLRYYRDLARRLADPNATAEYIAASPDLVIWRRGFKPDDGHPYVLGILKSYPMPKTQDEIERLGPTGIPYRYPIYGV